MTKHLAFLSFFLSLSLCPTPSQCSSAQHNTIHTTQHSRDSFTLTPIGPSSPIIPPPLHLVLAVLLLLLLLDHLLLWRLHNLSRRCHSRPCLCTSTSTTPTTTTDDTLLGRRLDKPLGQRLGSHLRLVALTLVLRRQPPREIRFPVVLVRAVKRRRGRLRHGWSSPWIIIIIIILLPPLVFSTKPTKPARRSFRGRGSVLVVKAAPISVKVLVGVVEGCRRVRGSDGRHRGGAARRV